MDEKFDFYFVEEIIPIYDEKENIVERYSIVLLKVEETYDLYNVDENHNYLIIEKNPNQILDFKEGNYIIFDTEANEFKSDANNSPLAKKYRLLNNIYRGLLISKNLESTSENITLEQDDLSNLENVFSYHVNVGHGNCSIIVIVNQNSEPKIWMVDCSNFDLRSRRYYNSNILDCINHIQTKFNIKKFEINKFFLTHSHFDHYSGVTFLINRNYFTSNTLCYLNIHYSMSNPSYTAMFNGINNLNCRIIEPLPTSNTNVISFWHPNKRTIKNMTNRYRAQDVLIINKPNNSSTVFKLDFKGLSIVFTGDIETERWDEINLCVPYMQKTSYFVVSHHGSLNGHLRTRCPVNRAIGNVSNCLSPYNTLNNAILMGRNNSFSGIYSQRVLNDFGNTIVLSEKDILQNTSKFLEIDWNTNTKNWIL